MDIVVASGNAGKLLELQALFQGCPVTLHAQSEFGVQSPPEDGHTFVENALIKARAAALKSGMASLADDSGLLVDALQGGPGLHSARFAGGAGDAANNALLLQRMQAIPEQRRGARFHCSCVFLRRSDDPAPVVAMADWPGRIVTIPRGEGGFGYDSLFRPAGLTMTSAQLPAKQKNALSHRGQAVASMIRQLRHEHGWG